MPDVITRRIHRNANPKIVYRNLSNWYIKCRWATDLEPLLDPTFRTSINYRESDEQYIQAATTLNPVKLEVDSIWWNYIRDSTRTLYCAVELRRPNPSEPNYTHSYVFIVNHDPVANAGHSVMVDPSGNVGANIYLDGSSSNDVDLYAEDYPDPGPLSYRWKLIDAPPDADPTGPILSAALNLEESESPLFLTAGTPVSMDDLGVYRFRLTVQDTDVAESGPGVGLPGEATATTTVILNVIPPELSIQFPTTESPFFGVNNGCGDGVWIFYSIGDQIANDPVYAGAWILRMTISQAIQSPIAPSLPVDTIVYEHSRVDFEQSGYFFWDGLISGESSGLESTWVGTPAYGAFNVKLELLNRDGNSTGIPLSVVEAQQSIIWDPYPWVAPVKQSFYDRKLTGGFMESGHAGYPGTAGKYSGGIHAGIDIGRVPGSPDMQPDVIAAKSGFFTPPPPGGHRMILWHDRPYQTRYLHCDQIEPDANSLVLQGAKLGRMSSVGADGAIHLHFETHLDDLMVQIIDNPTATITNPLHVVSMLDDVPPEINGIYIRQAPEPLQPGVFYVEPAHLSQAKKGIEDWADLIVLCRDRSHPNRDEPLDNGPYCLRVEETRATATWTEIRFDSFVPEKSNLSMFYAREGAYDQPRGAHPDAPKHHYLPYLRWDTRSYNRTGGPLKLKVIVEDIQRQRDTRTIVIGPEVTIEKNPPGPVSVQNSSAIIDVVLEVTAHLLGLDVVEDNYHIDLVYLPQGWKLLSPDPSDMPFRTGPMSDGKNIPLKAQIQIPPSPNLISTYVEWVVYSDILRNVGTRATLVVEAS